MGWVMVMDMADRTVFILDFTGTHSKSAIPQIFF